ncbi:hypothetical protein BDW74DRAFT_25156 [Aspergillus multicolor]|uniref:uncharacterized protein n=1 Tax=Aspergillus multicolor TaxID=41759 RepID=UPI003CCD792E
MLWTPLSPAPISNATSARAYLWVSTPCRELCLPPFSLLITDLALNSRHKSKAHHVCELGCVDKAFSSPRNRVRHYGNAHGQSTFSYQCACNTKFSGERRDNYLRHLKSCSTSLQQPYICGRDSHRTYDKVEHIAHLQACKGQVGRKKKKNQTRSQTYQE